MIMSPKRCLAFFILFTFLVVLLEILEDRNYDVETPPIPKYIQPFRPLLIRVANAVGRILNRIGVLDWLLPIEADALLGQACNNVGQSFQDCILNQHNFSEGLLDRIQWFKGLELLTESLRSSSNLTLIGRVIATGQIVGMLEMRAKLMPIFKRPTNEKIEAPIFIAGLPRTGTTFLHRLLSLDPMNRGPMLWEYMDLVPQPPPPPDVSSASSSQLEQYNNIVKERIENEQWKLDQYKSLAPGIDSMHPMNATAQEECILILNHMFDSQQFDATYPGMHTFMEWLSSLENHRATMEWHKRVLQYMQKNDAFGPRRWVLKAPYYLALLNDIRATYPDAKIIQTHRDPMKSIVSWASLVAKTFGIVSDTIDLHAIGQHIRNAASSLLQKNLEFREQLIREVQNNPDSLVGQKSIIDVYFHELNEDPIGVVKKIYSTLLGRKLSTEVENIMTQWLHDNPKGKHGRHRPDAAVFKLTRGDVMKDSSIQNYVNTFKNIVIKNISVGQHTAEKYNNRLAREDL